MKCLRRLYCIFLFFSAQAGRSGKTVPELEKTIGLTKKVVEKVQRENEDLKKSPAVVSNEKLLSLEQENERLKVLIYLKLHIQIAVHIQISREIQQRAYC